MVMDMSRRGGNAEPPVWTYGEPPPSPARPPVRAPSPSPPPPPPSSDEAAALITALDACESTWREDQASVARPKAQAAGGVGTGGVGTGSGSGGSGDGGGGGRRTNGSDGGSGSGSADRGSRRRHRRKTTSPPAQSVPETRYPQPSEVDSDTSLPIEETRTVAQVESETARARERVAVRSFVPTKPTASARPPAREHRPANDGASAIT